MKSLRFLCLALVAGLMLGTAHQVLASAPASPLPTIKEPSSARFDITGTVSSPDLDKAGFSIGITGDGAAADGKLQENITINFSGSGVPSGANNLTTSVIYADGKYYLKTSGTGSPQDDKWYYTEMPAGMSTSGTGLAGLDPKYADAYTTTEVGQDTINGASTTKYQVNVDLQKLYSLSGLNTSTTQQMAQDSSMTVFMWVGDSDQYLYKEQVVFNIKSSVPSSTGSGQTEFGLSMEISLTFKDFNAPITIDVPANAEPLSNLGASASSSSTMAGMPGPLSFVNSFVGMAGAMPSQGTGAMPTGMPSTGAGQSSPPLALLALALLSLMAGLAIRRRAPAS